MLSGNAFKFMWVGGVVVQLITLNRGILTYVQEFSSIIIYYELWKL
jgi:hypothetical protein